MYTGGGIRLLLYTQVGRAIHHLSDPQQIIDI